MKTHITKLFSQILVLACISIASHASPPDERETAILNDSVVQAIIAALEQKDQVQYTLNTSNEQWACFGGLYDTPDPQYPGCLFDFTFESPLTSDNTVKEINLSGRLYSVVQRASNGQTNVLQENVVEINSVKMSERAVAK